MPDTDDGPGGSIGGGDTPGIGAELEPIPCVPDPTIIAGVQGSSVSCTFDAAGSVTTPSSFNVRAFVTTNLNATIDTPLNQMTEVTGTKVSTTAATPGSGSNYQFSATVQQAFNADHKLILVVDISDRQKAKAAVTINV